MILCGGAFNTRDVGVNDDVYHVDDPDKLLETLKREVLGFVDNEDTAPSDRILGDQEVLKPLE